MKLQTAGLFVAALLLTLTFHGIANQQSHLRSGDFATLAQIDSIETTNNTEILPEFPGGMQAMQEFIRKNLKYPRKARKKNIEGTIYVKFFVETDGSIERMEILKSKEENKLLEEEAIRMVRSMPAWKPGSIKGKAVPVAMTLPLRFTLK